MEKIHILDTIIQERRAVYPKDYLNQPIPPDVLEAVIRNATLAPNHKMTQPWKFVVFTGDGKTSLSEELGRLYDQRTKPEAHSQQKRSDMMSKPLQSGAAIALVLDGHPKLLPEWEEVAALGCAVENLWLSCSVRGIGAYWSTPGLIEDLADFLHLGEYQKCLGIFYLGYTEAHPLMPERRPIEEKIIWRNEF